MKKITFNKKLIGPIAIGLLVVITFSHILLGNKTLTTGLITDGVMGREVSSSFVSPSIENAGNIIDRGGSAWQDDPLSIAVGAAYRKLDLPLWNANQGFGRPLGADMMSAAFNPIKIPFIILPSIRMLDAFLVLRFFIAAAGMFVFLKNKKLKTLASIIGGILYIFSGYFVYFLNMGHLSVEMMIPWLLYAIDKLNEGGSPRKIVLLITVISLMILGGHPESLVLSFIFAIYYVLAITLDKQFKLKTYLHSVIRMACWIALSSLIAIGLLGFFIVPFIEYYQNSDIGYHISENRVWANSLSSEQFILQFFPSMIKSAVESKVYNFFGYFSIIFLIFSAFNFKHRKLMIIFIIAFVILSAKVFGLITFNLIAHVPVLNVFVYYKYLQPEISFALAVLGAIGVDYISKLRISWKALLAAVCGQVLMTIMLYKTASSLVLSEITWISVIPIILPFIFLLLLIFLVVFRQRKFFLNQALHILLIFVIATSICLIPRTQVTRNDPYTIQPYISFLLSQETPFRTYSSDYLLYPATSSVFGINDIRDLHAVYPRAYMSYIRYFVDNNASDRFSDPISYESIINNQFLDLANVKYLLVSKSNSSVREIIRKNSSYKLRYDGEIEIYENLNALPRAYLVHNVTLVDSEDEAVAVMLDAEFNGRDTAVVIDGTDSVNLSTDVIEAQNDRIQLLTYSDREITLTTESEKKSFLVLSDIFYPGWVAYVDGKKTSIYQANIAFRGIPVSEGKHSITFKYEPRSYLLGSVLSLVSILTLIGFIFRSKSYKS